MPASCIRKSWQGPSPAIPAARPAPRVVERVVERAAEEEVHADKALLAGEAAASTPPSLGWIGSALGTVDAAPGATAPGTARAPSCGSSSVQDSSGAMRRSGASTHLRSAEFHTDQTPLMSSGTGASERTCGALGRWRGGEHLHAEASRGHRSEGRWRRGEHLYPALAQRLFVALAHVPVRREEPHHPCRVAHLLVAHAVVDELALAQFIRAQLVLMTLAGRRAGEDDARAHMLGAAHAVSLVPHVPIADFPHALDRLGDARRVLMMEAIKGVIRGHQRRELST